MAADWSADSGNIQVQTFVQSGPYYLPFNFLTIPAGGGVSNDFQICRSPVTEPDLEPVWIFLIASADPEMELVDGVVYGKGGSFDGQELYSKVTLINSGASYAGGTTDAGWQFLLDRMNLRLPTAEELTWAENGTSPGIQKWTPRFKVGGVPAAINEFGFDTGDKVIPGSRNAKYKKLWAVKQ